MSGFCRFTYDRCYHALILAYRSGNQFFEFWPFMCSSFGPLIILLIFIYKWENSMVMNQTYKKGEKNRTQNAYILLDVFYPTAEMKQVSSQQHLFLNKLPGDCPMVKVQKASHSSILPYPEIQLQTHLSGVSTSTTQSGAFGLKIISFKNASTSRHGSALNSYYLCALSDTLFFLYIINLMPFSLQKYSFQELLEI